jgi:hypothetical protein
MKKKRVGKRGRKGWRKRSPRCTLCTAIRWMGNIKGRHPMRELKQLDKEKHDKIESISATTTRMGQDS